MQKSSIRKYSVLGLVLLAASAVTAAIIPSKSDKNNFAAGSLTAVGTDLVTCTVTNIIDQSCNASTTATPGVTNTTAGGVQSDFTISSASGDFGLGMDNTSDNS